MAAALIFQGHIKAAFSPVYQAVEGSSFAYFFCFVAYLAMPEPSPAVVLVSALVTYCPPHEFWASLMAAIPDNFKIPVLFSSIFGGVYWINGLFCLALERYFGKYLMDYRIQELKAHSRPGMGKLFWNVVRSTCLAPVIFTVMSWFLKLTPEDFLVPGPFEMALSGLSGVVMNEILFFYGHWLFHANKTLYAKVHKVHHEFRAPCAFAAVYCHPIELVLSDFIPLAAGIICFNMNLYFASVFTTFAVMGTQTHHCGFRWPWIPTHGNQPDFHDYHHERFNCNYGNIGFLDALHGTDASNLPGASPPPPFYKRAAAAKAA